MKVAVEKLGNTTLTTLISINDRVVLDDILVRFSWDNINHPRRGAARQCDVARGNSWAY